MEVKALGARIGDVRFDPNAEDGDGDGLVQDSSAFERPATPGIPRMTQALTGGITGNASREQSRARRRAMESDIARTRRERSSLEGLRSQVVKPTGHRKNLVPKRTVTYKVDGKRFGHTSTTHTGRARAPFPHPSEIQPKRFDWLAGLSDEEIADVLIAESPEDMAILAAQVKMGDLLLGAPMDDAIIVDGMDAIRRNLSSLQPHLSPENYDRLTRLLDIKHSRESDFAVADIATDLMAALNTAGISAEDTTDILDSIQEILDLETDAMNSIVQEAASNLAFLKNQHIYFGFDFSQDAQDAARQVLLDSLRSAPFSWAVRTFGAPPINGISRAFNRQARTATGQDRRSDTMKSAAAFFFMNAFSMTVNTNSKAWRNGDLPEGPMGGNDPRDPSNPFAWEEMVSVLTGDTIPRTEVFHNVGMTLADVLRHEWGHYFWSLFTGGADGSGKSSERLSLHGIDLLDQARIETSLREWFPMVRDTTPRSDRGKMFDDIPMLITDSALSPSIFSEDNELAERLKEMGLAYDAQGIREYRSYCFYNLAIKEPLLQIYVGGYADPAIMEQKPTAYGMTGLLTPLGEQKLLTFLEGTNTAIPNPLYAPNETWHMLSREKRPRVFSVYAMSSPQETWAEGVAAFLSEFPETRATASGEFRDMLREAMGIPNTGGDESRPWLTRASGLRSSTLPSDDPDAPNMSLMPTYPKEVGGLRSRVDLDTRATALGIDLRPFRDTSQDADDIEWSTNDWSFSKTNRVEAGDAVIVRQGENGPEVLMISRKSGPFRGAMSLPGGMREGDETLDRSALREAIEEVSVGEGDARAVKFLGEVDTRDWDPRFVEGGRIGGVRMDVPDDTQAQAGDDARAFTWVPIEDIASGKHSIAFGHATWLAEAFRDDESLYERLSVISQASRVRNHRIIAAVDRERAKRGIKQFGRLPSPNEPYRTVERTDRLGLDGTTPIGLPYSAKKMGEMRVRDNITTRGDVISGSARRTELLREAIRQLESTGEWKGGDIGVSITPGRAPANISKADIERNGWADRIKADAEEQIANADELVRREQALLDTDRERLQRRLASYPNYEEFDDIRDNEELMSMLSDISSATDELGLPERDAIFTDGDYEYVVSLGDAIPPTRPNNPVRLSEATWDERRGDGDGGVHIFRRLSADPDGAVERVASMAYPKRGGDGRSALASSVWYGWSRSVVEAHKTKGMRSRSVFVPNDDTEVEMERVADNLGVNPADVEDSLSDMVREFGRSIQGDYHPRLDGNRAAEADKSVRITVASDGMPVVRGEPHPVVREALGDMVDGWQLEMPDNEVIARAIDDLAPKTARYRVVNDGDIVGEVFIGDRVIGRIRREADGTKSIVDVDPEYPALSRVTLDTNISYIEDKFSDWLRGLLGKEFTEKNGNRRRIAWSTIYREGLRDPRLLDITRGFLGVHDIVGHFGTGNGFDRHGEFSNAMFMMSVIDLAESRGAISPSDAETLKRSVFWYERKRLPFGRLDEDIDEFNPNWRRHKDVLARLRNPIATDGGFDGEIYVGSIDEDLIRPLMEAARGRQGRGLRSQTVKDPESISTAMAYELFDPLSGRNEDRTREALIGRRARNAMPVEGLRSSVVVPLDKPNKPQRTLSSGALLPEAESKVAQMGGNTPHTLTQEVWSAGDKKVTFGAPEVAQLADYGFMGQSATPDFGLDDDTEVIPLNPFAISGMDYTSQEGQELARQFAYAYMETNDGRDSREPTTRAAALLYAGVRGDEDAMKEFTRLAQEGKRKIDEANEGRAVEARRFIEQYRESHDADIKSAGLDGAGVQQLALVHETQYEPQFDAEGNIILRPMGDYYTEDVNGNQSRYGRQTLHFALNHIVAGHMERQGVSDKDSYIIVSSLAPTLDKNPGSLDNLYIVDTFLTPAPGSPLVLPKDSARVVRVPAGTSPEERQRLFTQAMEELKVTHIPQSQVADKAKIWNVSEDDVRSDPERYGIKPRVVEFPGGAHYSPSNGATAVVTRIAADMGVSSTLHDYHPSKKMEEVVPGVAKSAPLSISQSGQLSPNGTARAFSHGMFNGSAWKGDETPMRGLWSKTSRPPSIQKYDSEFQDKYDQEVPDGDGDCFSVAMDQARALANAYDDVRVVHGEPLGTGGEAKGIRFPHAWVEFTKDGVPMVRDFSNGGSWEIPRVVYYAIGNINEDDARYYDIREAQRLTLENEHYGPW